MSVMFCTSWNIEDEYLLAFAAHLERALSHDLERHDGGPLLHQQLGAGRHGAGGNAADVCVVAAGGHEEDGHALVEYRRDDRYVGQVAAACDSVQKICRKYA